MKNFLQQVKKYDLLEHLLFLALLAFAIVFYEERLLADSGYYLLQLINNENFVVEHNRFILILSQWLPLLAVKFSVPLKQILLLYSIGHAIFFYLIYLICKNVFRNNIAGILMLLLQTLGIMSGFFTPMFELYYGAALLVLFASILYHSPEKKINWLILVLIEFVAVSGHPFANFLLLFILALHAYQFRFQYIKLYAVFIIVIIGTFIFKLKTATPYEQGKSQAFLDTLHNGIYNVEYIKGLMHFLAEYYMELMLLAIFPVIFFIYKKSYFLLAIYVFSFVGMLALINVSYYGFEHSRYQEQVYFPLSFIATYSFCFYLLRDQKYKPVLYSLAILIFILRLNYIWKDGMHFRLRVETMKQLIHKAQDLPVSKFVISEDYVLQKSKMDANWSYAIETMLLSGANTNKTVTICTDADINFEQNKSKLKPDEYLFRRWEIYKSNSLNPAYFKLQNADYIYLDNSN